MVDAAGRRAGRMRLRVFGTGAAARSRRRTSILRTSAALIAAMACLILCAPLALAEDALSPPPGSNLILETHADGVQVYVCAKKDAAFAWTFDGPAAALFNASGREIGTHGKGPIWTLADGSGLIGEVVDKRESPQAGAIPWLLLKVKTHIGTFGTLTGVETVRRIDTRGGGAPPDGCDSARDGDVARIRYSAVYQFYGPRTAD